MEEKKSILERYESMEKTAWFKNAYENRSIDPSDSINANSPQLKKKVEEEKVTISKMFKFITWKDTQRLNRNSDGTWHIFEVSQWVFIGTDLDLWKKYKEENK